MYKQLPKDIITGNHPNLVLRISDNATIPFDETNSDYQEYLRWVAEGITPEPAEEE